jgi:hypothetical protein
MLPADVGSAAQMAEAKTVYAVLCLSIIPEAANAHSGSRREMTVPARLHGSCIDTAKKGWVG